MRQLERRGRTDLIDAIAACEKAMDFVSSDLLRAILKDTEQHVDYLETELALLKLLGLQNFLQSRAEQAHSRSGLARGAHARARPGPSPHSSLVISQ